MIRFRDSLGTLIEDNIDPKKIGFIEVFASDDKVACAIYEDKQGLVHVVSSKSAEAPRYSSIFNVTFSEIINLPEELI